MSDAHIGPIHAPTFRLSLNDEDKSQLDRIEAMLVRLVGEEAPSITIDSIPIGEWRKLFEAIKGGGDAG